MKHVSSMTLVIALLHPFLATEARSGADVKRVAAIVTEYRHNSHADLIVSRLFQTDTLDGKGPQRRLKLVSLYMDQLPRARRAGPWPKRTASRSVLGGQGTHARQ